MQVRLGFSSPKNGKLFLSAIFVGVILSFMITHITITYFPYNIPNKGIFAIIISAITSFVFVIMFLNIAINQNLDIKIDSRLIFITVYIFALAAIASLSFSNLPVKVLSCNDLLSIVTRFVPVILITAFLPGYTVLKTLKLDDNMSHGERFSCAILLSILITSFVGFLAWNLGCMARYASVMLVAINMVILLGFMLTARSKKLGAFSTVFMKRRINFDFMNFIIITLLVLFCYLVYFTVHDVYLSPLPLLGDEFSHIGHIVKFLNNYYSWQEITLGALTMPAYPYFFHLFEAVGVTLSKIPVTDFYILSSFLLLPFPTLSFFSLSKSLTKDKTRTVLSTVVFQLFSGFGWIYAILDYAPNSEVALILSSAECTCDIIYSTWLPVIVAPYLIDLAVFLFVLNLILKRNINSKKLMFLLIPLLLLSMLTHLEKTLLLSFLASMLAIIQLLLQTKLFRTKELGIALLISSGLVLIIDKIACKSLFTSSLLMTITATIGASFTIIVFSMIKIGSIGWIQKCKQFFVKNIKMIILFFVLFAIVIWQFELYMQAEPLPYCRVIPLHFLPLKLGVAGAFTLAWGFSLSKDNIRKHTALLFLVFTVFIAQILIYHTPYPLYKILGTYTEEFRFIRDITWPAIAIACASGIIITIDKINKIGIGLRDAEQKSLRILVCALLIGMVMSSSTLSHLLKIEYMAASSGIDESAYGIAKFMENLTIPLGASIFAPTSISRAIYSITGTPTYTPTTPFYGNILSKSSDPASILFTLRYLNVSYVITSKPDDKSCLRQILQYFPKIYSDKLYSIYKLTAYSHPSVFAETTIVVNGFQLEEALEFGFERDFLWLEDFRTIDKWKPDFTTFSNVIRYEVESTFNNTARIAVEGERDSKIVMFYRINLQNPICVEENIYILVKFKTQGATKLLVHVLYDDGTMSNAMYENSAFMRSEEWATSSTLIEKVGRHIIGFRVGVTNKFDEHTNQLLAEVDYIAILRTPKTARNIDAIAALALAGVEYTIDYDVNSSRVGAHKNIVVIEEGNSNNTLAQLLQLLEKDKNVLILGDLSESKWASNLISIKVINETLPARCIKIGESIYDVPLLHVKEITQSGGEVLAWYSNNNKTVPLLVRIRVENEALNYLNIWPLLDKMKDLDAEKELIKLQQVLKVLFTKVLNLSQSDFMNRFFYLKNTGSIDMKGNINITCFNAIFPKNVYMNIGNDLDGSCLLNINGCIKIRPYGFGFTLVVIRGNMKMLLNGNSVFESNFQELKMLVKTSQISGCGKIKFNSLTSGFPYRVKLENVEHECIGPFNIEMLPLSNDIFFLYPHNLHGF